MTETISYKAELDFLPENICSDIFDISSFLSFGDLSDEYQVVKTSAEWIAENKNSYIYSSQSCKNRIKNIIDSLSTNNTESIFLSLKSFTEVFLNNPYIYEMCTDKNILEKKAVSNDIMCYFVKAGNLILPLGALNILKPEIILHVIKAFMETRNNMFQDMLLKNKQALQNHLEKNTQIKKSSRKHTLRLLVTFAILIPAILFVAKRLVFGVEWSKISEYTKGASNIINAIGFLTEKSYNINHNSYAGFVCIVISLLWTLIILKLWAPCINGIKTAFANSGKIHTYNECENLKAKTEELISENNLRLNFLQENLSKLDRIEFCPTGNCFSDIAEKLNTRIKLSEKKASRRKLPKTFTLIILFVMMFSTVKFNENLDNPDFIKTINTYSDKISCYLDNSSLYAAKKYTVTASSHLYALCSQESLILSDIEPGEFFTVTEAAGEDESSKKIKIHTEYGYMEGWLFNPSLLEYTLNENDGYTVVSPKEVTASSTGAGTPLNVCDNKSYTLWGEDGQNGSTGEYLTFNYSEPSLIKLIMIQAGNCYSDHLFTVSSRPVGFSIEFYKNGEMQDVCHITLDDTQKKQYIHLNYPVEADSIRFTINEVKEGTLNKNSYVTEITTYSDTETQN